MPFDPEEYWKDKLYKCWVVCLTARNGTIKPAKGRRDFHAYYNVQAKTAERAIEVAKLYCTVLTGTIHGTARLAEPSDLGCSEERNH